MVDATHAPSMAGDRYLLLVRSITCSATDALMVESPSAGRPAPDDKLADGARDEHLAAPFAHTIAITANGPEILTQV